MLDLGGPLHTGPSHIWIAHSSLGWQPMLKIGEGSSHGAGAAAPVVDLVNDSEVRWGNGSGGTMIGWGI
jgi:hypothetical protein